MSDYNGRIAGLVLAVNLVLKLEVRPSYYQLIKVFGRALRGSAIIKREPKYSISMI